MLYKIVYLLASINCAYIAYMFYKSHNGLLRKIVILIFGSLSFGTLARVTFEEYLHPDIVVLVVVVPFCISTMLFAHYIRKTKHH